MRYFVGRIRGVVQRAGDGSGPDPSDVVDVELLNKRVVRAMRCYVYEPRELFTVHLPFTSFQVGREGGETLQVGRISIVVAATSVADADQKARAWFAVQANAPTAPAQFSLGPWQEAVPGSIRLRVPPGGLAITAKVGDVVVVPVIYGSRH